jgi:hypothetical protein
MPTADSLRLSQVFYVSRSLAKPVEVEQILQGARRQNHQHGVTGALLFTGGHFAQLLEGPSQAIAITMAVISADRRHEGLKRLLDGEITQRRFDGWSMAFIKAPGADDLMEQLLAAPEVPAARAERVLGLMLGTPGA